MRTLLLVALTATIFFVAGCEDMRQSSVPVEVSPTASARPESSRQPAPEEFSAMAAPAQPQAPAVPPPSHFSTTQPLPAGWAYLNEKELAPIVR